MNKHARWIRKTIKMKIMEISRTHPGAGGEISNLSARGMSAPELKKKREGN